jgi:hypothetical protein
VCSLPWRLRTLCGYDRKLCADVVGAFVSEMERSLRFQAKHELKLPSARAAHTGVVTFVQRFDSGLRLNVHAHCLVLDGVYVRDPSGALVFHPLGAPSAEQVAEVAARTAARVERVLRRHGRSPEDEPGDDEDPLVQKDPALAACYGAAARGLELFGPRRGQRTLRLVDPSEGRALEPVAEVAGFNVHAKVVVDGRDRARLERLCRYLGRPPIAQERLECLPDGRIRYTMKKAWRDGTKAIVFQPMDLIARLCAMVPPPRMHLIRFHGVFAPHSKLRREVVPAPPAPTPNPAKQTAQLELLSEAGDRPSRKPWAWLLRHVFEADVTTCPKCRGPMCWLEVATTPDAIRRLLAAHGLKPAPKPTPRAPPPEQLAFGFLG